MRGSRVLLLGATGFVGHYTSALLHALGAHVIGSTRKSTLDDESNPHLVGRVDGSGGGGSGERGSWKSDESVAHAGVSAAGVSQWVTVDIADRESVGRALENVAPDIVINSSRHGFARGESGFGPMWSVNLFGVANVLDALASFPGVKCVQVGSSTEYEPSSLPLAEDAPERPVGDFGRTKAAASRLVTTWAMGSGRDAAIVRPFKIYGPGEHSFRFLPALFRALTDGVALPLAENTRRDYVHAWDVASSVIRAATVASPEVPCFSVGTGASHSPHEVVALAEAVTGRRVPIAEGGLEADPIDAPEWRADTSRMEREWGWVPDISLEEGLRSWWQQIS